MNKHLFVLLFLLANSSSVFASEVAFETLWIKIRDQSPSISSEKHEVNASEIAVSRAEKHWLPSLGLSGQGFSTNDPGGNFFSNLSQREITLTDFSPSNLNEPGRHTFERFSLGVDLPLYEGGRKISELRALGKSKEAYTARKNAVTLGQYIETASTYAGLSSTRVAYERVKALLEKVSDLISRYSIGNKSNPVGYSGELGLKGLRNRAEGVSVELKAREDAFYSVLSQKAKLNVGEWEVKKESLASFLDRTMPANQKADVFSFFQKAAIAKSEAIDSMKDAEKARFLPKVGLFAQEDLTHGSRDTGTSFVGGVYLQWSLFNSDSLGRVGEQEEHRLAAISSAASIKESDEIDRTTMIQREEAMKKNLQLLNESEELLSEQVKVASRLFQSGSITALQLAEVLNRRVDLILNLKELEQNFIEIRAKRMGLNQGEGVDL